VPVPVKREVQKSEANPESTDLRPRHLPVQVRAKREVDEKEGQALMVSHLAGSQEAERLLLRLSRGRGNRSAERKRARGLRRQGHNKSW
jgi:hypothetical protein